MKMLKAKPAPPQDICLSIDPGSSVSAWCLWDGNTILHGATHKLMSEHSSTVEDTADVINRINEIMVVIDALLHGREYHVLIERQMVAKQDLKRALLFNREPMQILITYYHLRGKHVELVDASERYEFMGIHKWRSLQRAQRKDAVVKQVDTLFKPRADGNVFANKQHDLAQWHQKLSRRDLADSLSQCLARSFRNLKDVYTGTRILPNTPKPVPLPHAAAPKRKKREEISTREEVQAKLQALITHLKIKYPSTPAGLSNHDRIIQAHKHDANNKQIAKFMQLLAAVNRKGTDIGTAANLALRLAAFAYTR